MNLIFYESPWPGAGYRQKIIEILKPHQWAFSAGCAPTVTQKAGQAAPGLTQQGVANTYTEQGCVNACDASPSCLSCDYNKQNSLCYFGTTQNPALVSNSVVDHYDFVYSCSNTGKWYSLLSYLGYWCSSSNFEMRMLASFVWPGMQECCLIARQQL